VLDEAFGLDWWNHDWPWTRLDIGTVISISPGIQIDDEISHLVR
jgi:hypothetical protein